MNDIILIILSVTVFLYILQTLFIYIGSHRLNYLQTKSLPNISVLVALRNEEKTLKACVESLLRLDYPQKALEILLINDRSRDRTLEIIEELKESSPLIKTIHIKKGIKGLSGKANAIAQGMEHCTGEIILVTDGDCQVSASWAKTHVSYYTKDVGLVGGFTLLDRRYDQTSLFGKIQSLDWTFLLSVGTGAMGFDLPLSVLGNNFSFRRDSYEKVGGYRKMGFTIIEDFALMKTLLKHTSSKVLYPIDPNMVVYSYPMPDLKSFYHQRKRWSAGGKEVGIYGKFLMFISHFIHILLPMTFFMLNSPIYPLLSFLCLFLADFYLLFRTTGKVYRRDLLIYFPLWEVFYFAYTIFFAPVLLFPTTIIWKDISYSWSFNRKMTKMLKHR